MTAPLSPVTVTRPADHKGKVDFAILTIRDDEFQAVLDRFPPFARARGRRIYNLHRLDLPAGGAYDVAVLKCIEQGNDEALDAARDVLEELEPRWLLVVGIAGGVPSDELTLGDVVVSTRIVDFSVEAVLQDKAPEFALMGGPVAKKAAVVLADLRALAGELGDWNGAASIGAARPPIEIDGGEFYGDEAWQAKARAGLARQAARSAPIVTAGAIGSSDRLVKDTKTLATFLLKAARQVIAVEMLSAGVYRVATERGVPIVAIRGLSDVVGFKRDPAWTAYACHSAAAFTRAFLRTGPIEPRASAPTKLKSLQLRGWRSIVDTGAPGIEIGDLNVLLGANGAGKSNLLSFFALLNASMEGRLNTFVGQDLGGAAAQLAGGPRRTPVVVARISFESDRGTNEYGFTLAHAADDRFLFTDEHCEQRLPDNERPIHVPLGAGHFESAMRAASQQEGPEAATARFIRATLLGWRFFHFHDTSARATVKLPGAVSDNLFLRADASNLAALLLRLRDESAASYQLIRATVGLAAPFFEDFVLEPEGPGGSMVRLRWRQKGDDIVYDAHQVSDGTLRLMCLATLLLQPSLPRLIVIDEPELGLHPYAIELLASMLRQASEKAQVVIATQSVPLVDALASPEELIIVDRQTGGSRFRRVEGEALREWLEDYTLGQVWVKNLLGGGPRS